MYTAMLDQQLSQTMASRGVGLADVLTRQLSSIANPQTPPAENEFMPLLPALPQRPPNNIGATAVPVSRTTNNQPAHVKSFHERVGLHAQEASRATGIPAKFMIAQAALESGWGQREIKAADGSPSFNLFGIKAGAGWKGKVVDARTTEYINGVAHSKVEKFRAYDSYADAFNDYARLLSKNPRYQNVITNAQDVRGFAVGLQRAGYATDPQYAAKLMNIINKSFAV
jgi:flagellar protein FlgJ